MPTYDYRCERTGEMFEQWQSFTDDALTVCPLIHESETVECGAPVKKVFSKVGISFKGEGFYKTDHGTKPPARSAESSSEKSDPPKASTTESSGSSAGSSTSSSGTGSDTAD